VKDLELLKRTLALPLSDEVKTQNISVPISMTRTVPGGAKLLWEWMCTNWEELEKRLPAGLGMLGHLVRCCTVGFTDQPWVDKITQFFAQRSTKGFEMALEQSMDAIKVKARWVQRDTEDVKTWLAENGYLS
jgi:aminopeptidase 2